MCTEFLAVAGQVLIAAIALHSGAWTSAARPFSSGPAIAAVVVWTYIAVLALLRLLLSHSRAFSFPSLWYHTAVLYGIQWVLILPTFRSVLIHNPSDLARNLVIADTVLATVALIVALSSRIGNTSVLVEYEGEIPPSREPLASVFSKATFSWVDQIVWTGYKKTLELSDVWNVSPDDKASSLLSDYRQVKRTSSLAWHLLKHFKYGILSQGAWAAMAGLLTFAPTLLLRQILRYIEDPDTVPRNSAWLFVGLLFVSTCASALTEGQALWIGRKVCIRLQAVIIGELYSKALKRRVGVRSSKTLGVDPEISDGQPAWWKKMLGVRDDDRKTKPKSEDGKEDESDAQVSTGAIINLMSVDSFKVADVSAYLHFLWATTPVQFILAVVLLYRILGFSSIAGIGAMLLLLPVNLMVARRFAAISRKISAATDARVDTTNEVLTNIRVIKFFAWEKRFINHVNEKRTTELRNLRMHYILWATSATIWGGAPIVITLLSFAIYTMVEKKDLIPSVAFTALSLFQILRIPLDQLADMVAHVQESKVSVDRIEEYLTEEDTEKYRQLRHDENGDGVPSIGFDRCTLTWASRSSALDPESDSFKIIDLDFRFVPGELNVIAGPTGCGKTSLLMALLGEMTLVEGKVHLPIPTSREDTVPDPQTGLTETVAYCAQQAWLVNDDIKQNILFARPYDASRYNEVVKACALEKDFEILQEGDKTLVGERGVTLSGGQKQRISLARALYSSSKHVLLDDVLSAVDSHTQKWIFEKALQGPLMDSRTCILVTHNVMLCLPQAKFGVILDNGKVSISGTPQEIMLSGKLSEDLTKSGTNSKAPSRNQSRINLNELEDLEGNEVEDGAKAAPNGNANGHAAKKISSEQDDDALTKTNRPKETKAEGSVKFGIIFMYFKALGGYMFWTIFALAFTAQNLSSVATNVWIRQWANAYASRQYGVSSATNTQSSFTVFREQPGTLPFLQTFMGSNNTASMKHPQGDPTEDVNAGYYLGVYACLGFALMFLTFFEEMVLFTGSLSASRKIHQRLLEGVSYAKFRFFDSTPLGQIMNRFSKDIEAVDQEVAPIVAGVVHCFASIIIIVILISVITPGFLIASVFISILYFFIGKFYIRAARDLKRIESVERSPLYQHFGETLAGMTTIRAYGDERRFIRDNLDKINSHNRPFIYTWATNRWLAFRVDFAGALVALSAGVFIVMSVGKIDAGAAGLAMSYAVTFTENVLWFVRLYGENEQNMNSVERVKEYMDVEREAPPVIEDKRPDADWPTEGAVEFANYTTRYRIDLDPVLRNINLKLQPCEKIGVVGRTGAGKSSMALALFRALEAETGKILIDGVDIGQIGLHDLRERIMMVPQDPTLFSGTIRSNLDPFELFTDEEIFEALRRVQLVGSPGAAANGSDREHAGTSRPSTAKLENKNPFQSLSSRVAESGTNLSQGQRQLLCLARALLKKPKILVMDEATASIDYNTDAKIQEAIRELRGQTIITIAHRLKTIVDYDRVVVLDRGEIVECGAPWELLRPRDDVEGAKRWFREMCEMSGEIEALEREAKLSWDSKRLIDDEA